MHFEMTDGSCCHFKGRSGSRRSGRERETASIFVRFSTFSMVSRARKPPTTITGQRTASATFAAAGTKYPSFL